MPVTLPAFSWLDTTESKQLTLPQLFEWLEQNERAANKNADIAESEHYLGKAEAYREVIEYLKENAEND